MSSPSGDTAWRPVFAALSNASARRLYARIVLQEEADPGADLSPSRRRHAIDALLRAGLIREHDGTYVASEDAFSTVLQNATRPARRMGVERFLTGEGRVDRYPASATDRRALLDHIVSDAFTPGEVLSEADLNERLARYDDDVATLRRYLVDHRLLERSPDGSRYGRPASDG